MYKVFTHVTFFGLFKSDVSRTTSTLEMAKKCHMLDVKNYNKLLWAEVNFFFITESLHIHTFKPYRLIGKLPDETKKRRCGFSNNRKTIKIY